MIKVVADDGIPFLREIPGKYTSVSFLPGHLITRNSLLNADALLVRTLTRCNENLLKDTSVKFIGTATIGTDHIDTAFCETHSIRWTNAPGCNSGAVLQYIGSALSFISAKSGHSLSGKTLGIIGAGHIGRKVVTLGHLLGMKVLVNDPPRQRTEGPAGFCSLDQVLDESDILTLHVPLARTGTDPTWYLLDENRLPGRRPDSWLINTSRGEVIDGKALKSLVKKGDAPRLILDVWENEPFPDKEMIAAAEIATPHIAGYSLEGKANASAAVVNELAHHFGIPDLHWFPDLPDTPAGKIIRIPAGRKSTEEVILEAISASYPVARDDARLRNSPENFAEIRKRYEYRREFPAFCVSLADSDTETENALKRLGFGVEFAA
jgi:erythronate-4-phosphate dehydrogenase